jgi:hypothetical protein
MPKSLRQRCAGNQFFLLDSSVFQEINLISNTFLSSYHKWIISRYRLSIDSVNSRYFYRLGLCLCSYTVTGVWFCALDRHICTYTQANNWLPCVESLSRSFTFNSQSHGTFDLWISIRDSDNYDD